MTADRASLNTFQVRVSFDMELRAFLHLHFTPQATYYFKRPDKSELVFDSLPPAASQFQHFYGSLGTPESWPNDYNIAYVGTGIVDSNPTYKLEMTPKNGAGNLDHLFMYVSTNDFGVVREEWYYHSGATIVMTQDNEHVGSYVLPKQQIADFHFPQYTAHAVSVYDGYHINVNVPDSVFSGG